MPPTMAHGEEVKQQTGKTTLCIFLGAAAAFAPMNLSSYEIPILEYALKFLAGGNYRGSGFTSCQKGQSHTDMNFARWRRRPLPWSVSLSWAMRAVITLCWKLSKAHILLKM